MMMEPISSLSYRQQYPASSYSLDPSTVRNLASVKLSVTGTFLRAESQSNRDSYHSIKGEACSLRQVKFMHEVQLASRAGKAHESNILPVSVLQIGNHHPNYDLLFSSIKPHHQLEVRLNCQCKGFVEDSITNPTTTK